MSTHWAPGNADFPASGVTPGTYGDATHSSQVTVAASGLVTAATSVLITGGGGGGGIGAILYDSTLGSAASSIDTGAAGIAGGYTMIVVYLTLATSDAGAQHSFLFRLNNDSGANYDVQYVYGAAGSPHAGTVNADTSWALDTHGAGGTANYPSAHVVTIPNYTGTTFYKVGTILEAVPDGTAANQLAIEYAAGYRSTLAISRAAVSVSGNNFVAGSRMTVLGF